MALHLTRVNRLFLVIGISFLFFLVEISAGFYTHSLALVADAFHYLNDLIGFIVALAAIKISERSEHPKKFSFGYQRAQLLGAFFNGVFLLALGVSIFLQSIERFISLQKVQNPKLILIVGCVGLALNILSASFLHEHEHGHEMSHQENSHSHSGQVDELSVIEIDRRDSLPVLVLRPHIEHRHKVNQPKNKSVHDFGMAGVFLHVLGDAVNNMGVIVAASVIWRTNSSARFYADPAISLAISFMILLSALPLVKRTGTILLESLPIGVDIDDVKHDIEKVNGVESIHELHIWRLNQQKSLASAHIVCSDDSISNFINKAKIMNECFHAYGIHSITLQPEFVKRNDRGAADDTPTLSQYGDGGEQQESLSGNSSSSGSSACLINCGQSCEEYTCCG